MPAGWFQSDQLLTSGSGVTRNISVFKQAPIRQGMRCLEFYSGLGGADTKQVLAQTQLRTVGLLDCTLPAGMHYALKQSFPDAEVVCAFDINTVANDVYQHNHSKRSYQVSTVRLCTLPGAKGFSLWLLVLVCTCLWLLSGTTPANSPAILHLQSPYVFSNELHA